MRASSLTALLALAGCAAGVPLGFVAGQATSSMRVQMLFEKVVTDIPQPTRVRVHDDRWGPGAETSTHDHPGPVILAVLEGELVEDSSSGQNSLRAGEVHWRSARRIHNVKNVSGQPARVLAIHFDPAP